MNVELEEVAAEVRRLTRIVEEALRHQSEPTQNPVLSLQTDCRSDLIRKPKAVLGSEMLLKAVQDEVRRRDFEEQLVPPEFCDGPAWYMLLFLLGQQINDRSCSVTDVTSAARAPQTTALRWIGVLVEAGWFRRASDPVDHRRCFLTLSKKAYEALATLFEARRVGRWRAGPCP